MQFRALGRGTEVALARPREIDTLQQRVETTDITVQILRDIRDTMNGRASPASSSGSERSKAG
jgi:hypothetical protein